jgi:hypothetical protein
MPTNSGLPTTPSRVDKPVCRWDPSRAHKASAYGGGFRTLPRRAVTRRGFFFRGCEAYLNPSPARLRRG